MSSSFHTSSSGLDGCSSSWNQQCALCAPRKPRHDLAPSPLRFTGGYSFFGTVSKLQETQCRRCTVIARAVLHFAGLFRPSEALEPDNISVECDSLMKQSDLFEDALSTSTSLLDISGKTRRDKFPAQLGVCFRFKDLPERGKIEVHGVSSPDTLQLPSDRQTQIDVLRNTIKMWVARCSTEHGGRCAPKPDSPVPTRLLTIDHGSVRLIEANTSSSIHTKPLLYLALSHCWGSDASHMRTLTTNIESMRHGISIQSLPKTFREAVALTTWLGYQFIWIDSLCIIQDDETDWQRESARMADIYKNAVLTVAATRSSNGDGGCFFDVYETPYIWRRIRQPWSDDDIEQPVLVEHPNLWKLHKEECDGFVRWFALRPGHDIRDLSHRSHYGENSRDVVKTGYPLLSRAWFYQERLLSPRVVQFGHMELAWECHEAFWSKSVWTEFRRDDATMQGRQNEIYPIEETRRLLGVFLCGSSPKPTPSAPQHNQSEPQDLWNLLIEEYSRLQITHLSDRLPALSGIAATMAAPLSHHLKTEGSSNKNQYLAGLWSGCLPGALYWTASPPSYRPCSYRAPTFSWASVEGPITYHKVVPREKGYSRYVCDVVGHSIRVDGLDPHGRVQGGHVELRGWAGTARISSSTGPLVSVVEQGDESVEGDQQKIRRQAFHPDASIDPDPVKSGDEVLLFLLECIKRPNYREPSVLRAAVLKQSVSVAGAYERIGLIATGPIQSTKVKHEDMRDWPTVWFPEKQTVKIM